RDFDEVTTERVGRELWLWIIECRFGLATACDQTQVGALKHIRKRHATSGAVSCYKDPATVESQLCGCALLKRRARGCRGDGEQRCDRVVCCLKDGRHYRCGR